MNNVWQYGSIAAASICYNESLLIGPWLDHLLESKQISFISIVDCGSVDGTLDIIAEKQKLYKGRILLQSVPWEKNFAALRNRSLEPLRAKNIDWMLFLDVDTFLNKNPDELFKILDKEVLYLYDDVRIPSVRFWSRSKAMGTIYPCCEHWGLIRMSRLKGFVGNLHETAAHTGNIFRLPLCIMNGIFLAHYDLAKINRIAEITNTSSAIIMGRKKLRYLQIRKLCGTLSPTDPNPDNMTQEDIESFGALKIEEELLSNPLKHIEVKHSRHLDGIL
jgi:glycosyltransferase involved in cell wall biosynthesis